MFQDYKKVFGRDKSINHEQLGKLTCSGLDNSYDQCIGMLERKYWMTHCFEFKTLADLCYGESASDFGLYVEKEYNKRLALKSVRIRF